VKKFFNLQNIIFLAIIALLFLGLVLSIRKAQKTAQSAAIFAGVAKARMGFSAFMAQKGIYPKAQNLILGSSGAKLLCLEKEPGLSSGFLPAGAVCRGTILANLEGLNSQSVFKYNADQTSYNLEFFLPSSLGAFTEAGFYCATEKGIRLGKCF